MLKKSAKGKYGQIVNKLLRVWIVAAFVLSAIPTQISSVYASDAEDNQMAEFGEVFADETGEITDTPDGEDPEEGSTIEQTEEPADEELEEEPEGDGSEDPPVEPPDEPLGDLASTSVEEAETLIPEIVVSISSLSKFSADLDTLSEAQTYEVSGSNLLDDISITAPKDFLISLDDVTYDSGLTLAQVDGSVAATIIYVRFIRSSSGTSSGSIAHASSGAEDQFIEVNGTVAAPTLVVTSSMTAFNQFVGMPSEEQSYTISGDLLAGDVTIDAPPDFEISKTSGADFTTSLTFTPVDGVLAESDVYVRLNAASAASYDDFINHSSEGAETVQLAVSGTAEELMVMAAEATSISFTGEELLGCPTDSSITINIIPGSTIEYRYQYGTSPGSYTGTTSTYTATGGEPHEVVISGLSANTKYYYRMQYHLPGETDWVERDEHTFWTQRAEGSTFSFAVTSDIHANRNNYLSNAMTNIYNALPDFMFDIGDTFMVDHTTSQSAVDSKYLAFRDPLYFDRVGHSIPIFLASGNHEEEEGWNLDDTFSIGVASIQARKAYYPTPVDGSFYSGNTDPLSDIDEATYGDELREDYYAWTWGDALFVVIDPFQYTMNLPYAPGSAGEGNDDPQDGDQWSWTLGAQQFQWLRDTLEGSDAKYKFVLSHQMLGGITRSIVGVGAGYVRGGAEASQYFEWGGKNGDGSEGFSTHRDPGQFGTVPIHQLFVQNGVSAYFHGHDHQYVYEKTHDGVVYQEMPQTSVSGSGFGGIYTEGSYDTFDTIKKLSSPGHLLITVSPSEATVEYISSTSITSTSTYTYTILPSTEDTTSPSVTIEQAAGQADPTSSSTIHYDVEFSESVSDFETDDVTISGTAGATTAVVTGSGTTYDVAVNGMTGSGTVVADLAAGVAHDGAGNPSLASTSTDNSVTYENSTASGEVVQDGTVSTNTGSSTDSVAVSHTTGTGANRMILVGTSWNCANGEADIASVVFTYGTEEIVFSEAVTAETSSTDDRFASIWYSASEPPAGTSGTLTVTFDATVDNGIAVGVANFAGVNLADPFTTTGTANSSSTGTTLSVTLDSLDGDELVFDTVFIGASSPPDPTVGADQDQLWTLLQSNARGAASIEQADSSSVEMSWTTGSTAVAWASAAVAIKPAPAGTTYNLTMAVNPGGGGTTTPAAGTSSYAADTVVDISATPAAGYEFMSWTGDVADAYAASTTVTMDGDKTVTANFTALYYTLTTDNDGLGTVTVDPDEVSYAYGTVVTLTPVPSGGYEFDEWTGADAGDVIDTAGVYTIVMDDDKAVTANFKEQTSSVVQDGTVSTNTGSSTDSVAVSHTTGTGANRMILVGTSWNCANGEADIASVVFTYGTEEIVFSEAVTAETSSTDDRFASIWYSASEPPGRDERHADRDLRCNG